MSKYNSYSEVVSDIVKRGEQVANNFWSILDHLDDFPFVTLTSTTNGARQFPPYNIIESEDGKVRLEMAIAGYTKDRITVEKEGNVLIIRGQPALPNEKETLRYRGISNASFCRTFDMNVHAQIGEVSLKEGILVIDVTLPKPASVPRSTFEIK
jgi:molecular chaperone IbpA